MRNPQNILLRVLKSVVRREGTPVSEKLATHDSRRLFVKQLAMAAAGTALSGQFFTCRSTHKPTIAIVGAGEHCSSQFQGFMNGAAETGRKAAGEIIRPLKPLRFQPASVRVNRADKV